MLKKDVISYFGGVKETSDKMRMHENSVRRWPSILPHAVAYKVELLTYGALLTDKSIKEGVLPRFDWDKYAESVTYREISKDVNGLSHVPTMFSSDKTQIYIKTEDESYSVDNYEGLRRRMSDILHEMSKAKKDIDINVVWSYRQIYLLESDYLTIWDILKENNELPDEHKWPEQNLRDVINGVYK
jgi:hypothetical protein